MSVVTVILPRPDFLAHHFFSRKIGNTPPPASTFCPLVSKKGDRGMYPKAEKDIHRQTASILRLHSEHPETSASARVPSLHNKSRQTTGCMEFACRTAFRFKPSTDNGHARMPGSATLLKSLVGGVIPRFHVLNFVSTPSIMGNSVTSRTSVSEFSQF